MRIAGKFLLFFSSYLVAFLILLIIEIPRLDLNMLFAVGYSNNWPSILLVIFYIACIIISIYSLITFRSTYNYPLPETQKKIKITSISNGASDLISYLLTIIIPIIGSGSLYDLSFSGTGAASSNIANVNQYIRLLIILIIFILVFLLYMNSTIIVINPMLNFIGYSLYKIKYKTGDKEVEIEGVLLANSRFDPEALPNEVQVNRIDNQIFLFGRV